MDVNCWQLLGIKPMAPVNMNIKTEDSILLQDGMIHDHCVLKKKCRAAQVWKIFVPIEGAA